MNREQVYADMKQTLGLVPTFFKTLPDEFLDQEWGLFKSFQLGETQIPNKYKELIGIAISAVEKCRYCSLFHTEAAKLHGATQEEIEEAVHLAKASAGWSTYINGLQIDYDQFKQEMNHIVDYIKSQAQQSTTAARGAEAGVSAQP